ncbi:hypothetical protein Tcan_00252 [Toxocara canis]|uniref:Uncharacterized protein n=1 Tax=Toxocara canis TaxID=6265 RepID=A0A0B2W538_TOXCA|nr:hypothetical protein Tcan_00252 [Toxocara canis]
MIIEFHKSHLIPIEAHLSAINDTAFLMSNHSERNKHAEQRIRICVTYSDATVPKRCPPVIVCDHFKVALHGLHACSCLRRLFHFVFKGRQKILAMQSQCRAFLKMCPIF